MTPAAEDLPGKLARLGLNGSEAKCYVALLELGAGKGYAVAQRAGVPTAKVYEALKALEAKGFAVSDRMREATYRPCPPEETLGRAKQRLDNDIDALLPALASLAAKPPEPASRLLSGERAVLGALRGLVANARTKLLMTAWPDELERLRPELERAAATVSTHLLAYGPFALPGATVHLHRRSDLVRRELPGRRLVAANDQGESVSAFFDDNDASEALWSASPGIAAVFADHILHDISLNVLIGSLPEPQAAAAELELTALRHQLYLHPQ